MSRSVSQPRCQGKRRRQSARAEEEKVMELNYLAVVVGAVTVFVVSATWYGVFGKRLAELNDVYADTGQPPVWKLLAEFARGLVVAAVVAGLTLEMGIEGWLAAVGLGLVLWIGFPAIILSGSVIHEKVPWKLAAIHAGDWLLKLIVIAVVVGVWP
jgi:hypothetical protein